MLTFKGNSLFYNNKEIAYVEVNDYLMGTEKYSVRLTSTCDRVTSSELKEYISAVDKFQPVTIAESVVIESLKKRLEEKLHQCLFMTDIAYRYNFELSQYKKRVEMLEKEVAEERKKRIELENELFELKQSLQVQDSEDESESEYNEN